MLKNPLSSSLFGAVKVAKKKTALQAPIAKETLALWAAFLFEGMFKTDLTKGREKNLLKACQINSVHIMTQACLYLPLLWENIAPYWNMEAEETGVFEYEVVNVFGKYLSDYLIKHKGTWPDDAEAIEVMQQLLNAFYTPDTTGADD